MANNQSILFSAPMILGLLADRKSETRRLQKPRWAPGDRVYVKEAHLLVDAGVIYRANWREDAKARGFDNIPDDDSRLRWRPSIHMHRASSRITLDILGVRREPLQALTTQGALNEGVQRVGAGVVGATPMALRWIIPGTDIASTASAIDCYRRLWEHINAIDSWRANPLVWVTQFGVLQENIDHAGRKERS